MDKKSSISNNGAVIKPKKRHHVPHFMKNVGWYFAILIVILLIVIMAVPSVSIFSKRGRGEGYNFGKFANRNIEFANSSYMLYAYNGIMQQYSRFLDNQQIMNMQMSIMQQAFQSAAVATATEYYGIKEGIVVSDEQIDNYIKENYTDESGKFNRDNWARISQGEKNRIRRFAKNDIIQNSIVEDIKFAPIPKGEIDILKVYKEEENRKNNANNESTENNEPIIDDTNQSIATAESNSEASEADHLDTTEDNSIEDSSVSADPSAVSETVVIRDIRDTATDRYSQSVLASPKLKDNFVSTYNKEILPQITRNNQENDTASTSTAEESTEDSSASADSNNEEVSTVEEAPLNANTNESSEDVVSTPSTPEAEVVSSDNPSNN